MSRPFTNTVTRQRHLVDELLAVDQRNKAIFNTRELRNLAKNLGFKAKGTSRIQLAASIAEHKEGVQLFAGLDYLVKEVKKIEVPSGLSQSSRDMLKYAKRKDWANMINLLTDISPFSGQPYMPMSELESLWGLVDLEVNGGHIVHADVKVMYPGTLGTIVYPNVAIRSHTSWPIASEIKAAIKDIEEGYHKHALDWADVQMSGLPLSDIPVVPHFDWQTRAHFGSMLSYPTTTRTFIAPTALGDSLKTDMKEDRCCYDAAYTDLSMTVAEIEAYLHKTADQGMTCYDMVDLYKSRNMSIYCFDLDQKIIDEGYWRPSNEERREARSGERVFVYIFANNHVYTPNSETRVRLLCKTPDKRENGDDSLGISTQKVEDDIIMLSSFDTCLLVAHTIDRKEQAQDPKMLQESYESRIAEVDSKIEQIKEANAEAIRAKKGNGIKTLAKDLITQKKAIEAESRTKLAQAKADWKKRKQTRIYIDEDDISEEYKQLVLSGKAYASDITPGLKVTQMKYAPRITIYANKDYVHLKKTADELKLNYINQAIPALARLSFKQYRDRRGSTGWESSVLNNAVSDLMGQFHTEALTFGNFASLDDMQTVAAVDFYRNYASTGRLGNFYTVPLLSDIADYDSHAVGPEPYLYYIETTEPYVFGGNGLFDYKVTEYGITKGLITQENIKAQIKATASPKVDATLKGFIDHVYETVTNDSHRKQLVNTLIGSLAIMDKHSEQKSMITDTLDEASYYYRTAGTTHKGIAHMGKIGDNDVYVVCARDVIMRRKTDELVRRAIVQRSRMEVHRLMCQIKEHFPIIHVKTDAVYYAKKVGEPGYPAGDGGFGSTRKERLSKEVKGIKMWNTLAPGIQKDTFKMVSQGWREPLGQLSKTEEFKAERLLQFNRAFVNGFAGAGKSEILKKLKEHFESQEKRVAVCAFTHAAARIVKGETAHKLLGLNKAGKQSEKQIKHIMTGVDVILIDEMSMIPSTIYSLLSQLPSTIRVFGFGDFRQLKPVEFDGIGEEDKRMYVDTTMFKSLFGYNMITLRKQWRHDAKAANACISFHDVAQVVGVPDAMSYLPEGIQRATEETKMPLRNVCMTNRKRREVNAKVMASEFKEPSCVSERVGAAYDRREGCKYTTEHYDARKLAHILANPNEYKDLLECSNRGKPEEVLLLARKYYANSTFSEDGMGHKRVEYYRASEGRGRWTPDGSQSLAFITRKIRHIIANDYYTDIDAVNCHPTILRQLCERQSIPTPKLVEYIEERDKVFAEIMASTSCDQDTAKTLILATINGGEALYKRLGCDKCVWMREFKAEMEAVGQAFLAKHPERIKEHIVYRRGNDKYEGSDVGAFVNMFLIEAEVRILDSIVCEMQQRRLLGMRDDDVVLCADGLMVPCSDKINDALLAELSRIVMQKTQFDMKFVIKSMDPQPMPSSLPMPTKSADMLELLEPRLWDEFTHLGEDMPVIANENRPKDAYFNNQTFIITHIGVGGISLTSRDDDRNIHISADQLRKDFRPAYCTTSHKAQGATIRGEYGIHEITCMNAHGAYVAITRAGDVKNIILFA